jgi:N-hydroxyarylamine O-acetyltransferase
VNSVELSAYLARIGIAAPKSTPPTIDLLIQIQRAHRSSIPFENLDLHLGKAIDLAPNAIFEKIVVNKRGGYCFEQNSLLLDALTGLGFDGRPALGRVWLSASSGSPAETPPRTHAINIIRIEGADWLADAGFGHGDAPVMRLTEQSIATADGAEYQLRQDRDYGWMMLRNGQRQYSFTLDPIWPTDLIQANHFTSTFCSSRFINNIIVSINSADGFANLFNDKLTISGKSQTLVDRSEYRRILHRYFGLTFSENEWSRLKLPFLSEA